MTRINQWTNTMQEDIETIDLRSTSFAPNLDNNGVLLLSISLFLVSLQLSLSLARTMFLGKYFLSLFCLLFTPFIFFHSSHFLTFPRVFSYPFL